MPSSNQEDQRKDNSILNKQLQNRWDKEEQIVTKLMRPQTLSGYIHPKVFLLVNLMEKRNCTGKSIHEKKRKLRATSLITRSLPYFLPSSLPLFLTPTFLPSLSSSSQSFLPYPPCLYSSIPFFFLHYLLPYRSSLFPLFLPPSIPSSLPSPL